MWQDILAAVALMLVFEGIMPFVNPQQFRRTLVTVSRMQDRTLRLSGLLCMLGGLLVLYAVR